MFTHPFTRLLLTNPKLIFSTDVFISLLFILEMVLCGANAVNAVEHDGYTYIMPECLYIIKANTLGNCGVFIFVDYGTINIAHQHISIYERM